MNDLKGHSKSPPLLPFDSLFNLKFYRFIGCNVFTSNYQVKCDSVEKRRSYRLFNVTTLKILHPLNMSEITEARVVKFCTVVGYIKR